jgi:RNA polymerase sigma-70 factor (ECF subfamily)
MDLPEPKLRPLWTGPTAPADDREREDIEAELIERARAGDMQAWSRLYQDHFDGLYRHLRYLTGDAQISEELVQDTFVKALECMRNYDGRARFSTWLHGIGLNIVRHHWRSERSTAKAHAKLIVLEQLRTSTQPSTPDKNVLARQRVRALYDALAELPIHLREAFILRELEGLELEEAAAQLGITTNNLAVRASRARTRLRRVLEGKP